jgi:hypothetical protein
MGGINDKLHLTREKVWAQAQAVHLKVKKNAGFFLR